MMRREQMSQAPFLDARPALCSAPRRAAARDGNGRAREAPAPGRGSALLRGSRRNRAATRRRGLWRARCFWCARCFWRAKGCWRGRDLWPTGGFPPCRPPGGTGRPAAGGQPGWPPRRPAGCRARGCAQGCARSPAGSTAGSRAGAQHGRGHGGKHGQRHARGAGQAGGGLDHAVAERDQRMGGGPRTGRGLVELGRARCRMAARHQHAAAPRLPGPRLPGPPLHPARMGRIRRGPIGLRPHRLRPHGLWRSTRRHVAPLPRRDTA